LKVAEFFSQRPVFTTDEFTEFLAGRDSFNPWTRQALLTYHTKRGRILRVRRGLYAVVGPGASPDTWPVDPYLLASKMTGDAVLGYHTALQFYGKAYSVREDFFYLSKKPSVPARFRSHRFRGIRFPKKLCDKRKETFGVKLAERVGMRVQVTSLERTLVDVLDRPELSGTWEEIWRSLELVEFFDLGMVVEYALLLDNSTTVSKVGFFLDQHRDALMVDDALHLRPLLARRPRSPHYMVRGGKGSGRFVRDWNLVVPNQIIQRSWAETT